MASARRDACRLRRGHPRATPARGRTMITTDGYHALIKEGDVPFCKDCNGTGYEGSMEQNGGCVWCGETGHVVGEADETRHTCIIGRSLDCADSIFTCSECREERSKIINWHARAIAAESLSTSQAKVVDAAREYMRARAAHEPTALARYTLQSALDNLDLVAEK